MLTLMIVDDESIIRRGIRFHIDWKSHDIEVVGEAGNGEEGLQKAISLKPDIIIADIKMPRMSGIHMAEQIRKLLPRTRIIFLSGYDDKEYLLSAIHNGIHDFVTKSANSNDILQAVLRCRDDINLSREEEKKSDALMLEYCFQNIRTGFMNDLIAGSLSTELLLEQAQMLDIPLSGPYYLPFLFYPAANGKLDDTVLSILFHLNIYTPFLACQPDQTVEGILNLPDPEFDDRILETMLAELNRAGDKNQLLIPPAPVSLANVPACFGRLLQFSSQLCWHAEEPVVICPEETFKEVPLDLLFLLEQEIITSFSQKNFVDVLGKAEQFYSFSQNRRVPLLQFKESMKRMTVTAFGISNEYEKAHTIVKAMDESRCVEEIYRLFLEVMENYSPGIPHNTIVRSALSYIEEHYREQIFLKDIATHCYVTPSYISKIFKEDIQIGIVQYIHELRIQKAKELLCSTDKKISEIALYVGYPDYKRFSSYFLKIAGTSPREYRLAYPPGHTDRPEETSFT